MTMWNEIVSQYNTRFIYRAQRRPSTTHTLKSYRINTLAATSSTLSHSQMLNKIRTIFLSLHFIHSQFTLIERVCTMYTHFSYIFDYYMYISARNIPFATLALYYTSFVYPIRFPNDVVPLFLCSNFFSRTTLVCLFIFVCFHSFFFHLFLSFAWLFIWKRLCKEYLPSIYFCKTSSPNMRSYFQRKNICSNAWFTQKEKVINNKNRIYGKWNWNSNHLDWYFMHSNCSLAFLWIRRAVLFMLIKLHNWSNCGRNLKQ